MFLRVVNSFADFKQNHRCKYFFLLFVFQTGYPKTTQLRFWKVFHQKFSLRDKEFYQELRKSPTEHYSASAHLSIRAAIDRYLNTLPEFSGISIIRDPLFKIAIKSLNAKLKQLKAQGFAKV